METELARTVDVVMARAKRTYILIIKVNKLFFFYSSRCFLKEIENMYPVFLSSYTNTRESLGGLEKAVQTLACGSCSHSISRSPKLPLVFPITRYKQGTCFLFLGCLTIFSFKSDKRKPLAIVDLDER